MPFIAAEDVTDEVKRFNRSMNQINDVLIDRQNEVAALKLAVITGSNLMLEGPPGTAKSRLAEEFFARLTGENLVLFDKQLMKGTQPDELFGPMKSKMYREQAIWEHNIEGMLPTAHFAFIDEVYRGSDMLLPSLLRILHEHKFMNGLTQVNCPLITAVGTTNFVTDTKELEAFHDRWLIRVKVLPLQSTTLRIKMLEKFLEQQQQHRPALALVSLEDIQKLRRQVCQLTLDPDAAELYEDVVQTYRKKAQNPYISDRRLCLALTIAQAATLLADPEAREVDTKNLFSSIYGIVPMGDKQQEILFTESCESVIEGFKQNIEENQNIKDLEEGYEIFRDEFTTDLTLDEAKKLFEEVKRVFTGIQNMSPNQRPKRVALQERLTEVTDNLSSLMQRISKHLSELTS